MGSRFHLIKKATKETLLGILRILGGRTGIISDRLSVFIETLNIGGSMASGVCAVSSVMFKPSM